MHILFLSDNFPPEVNAPASRTFEHCREWVNSGHQVTVVTCVPNFPQGKVYAGYQNKLWQIEVMDGVRVVRVWTYVTANEGFAKRILDYLSFMVMGFMAALFIRKPDLVVGTSPQFFTVCAAYVVGFLKKIPFVFELRDLWPESIKAVGAMRDSPLLGLFERLELFLYRKASRIISVTESFREVLVSRGIPSEKIDVVMNGVDLTRFKPMDKDLELVHRYGLTDKFVAGYIGTLGMAHALETLLDAAERLHNSGHDDICLLLLGDGARKQALMERARNMSLNNVVFIDSVPKEDVPRYWSLLDISIIHLKRTEVFTKVIPSKIFESFGMGVPILHGVAGESAQIVEKEGGGLIFEPENVDQLYEKLLCLKNDKELRGNIRDKCLIAKSHYDRKELANKMLEKLLEVSKIVKK